MVQRPLMCQKIGIFQGECDCSCHDAFKVLWETMVEVQHICSIRLTFMTRFYLYSMKTCLKEHSASCPQTHLLASVASLECQRSSHTHLTVLFLCGNPRSSAWLYISEESEWSSEKNERDRVVLSIEKRLFSTNFLANFLQLHSAQSLELTSILWGISLEAGTKCYASFHNSSSLLQSYCPL